MLIKYILILFLTTPNCNDSLSIRKDIEFAKLFLKYYGISDENVCKKGQINELCSVEQEEICSARLLSKKMEFKQFDNRCYMDLDNFCESLDNIWAIKNTGPCVFNAELRRYAKEAEDIAESNPQTDSTDGNKDDGDNNETDSPDTTYETTTDVSVTDTNDETEATDTTIDEINEATTETDEAETVTDETTIDQEAETTTVAELAMGNVEIGKIIYDDGSEKRALRSDNSDTTRFPPMLGEKTFNNIPCSKRVRPCPVIYYPMCLYYMKEKPNNITYYYFINKCEAEQWTCYHPERKIDGYSSMRAGYCSHIQYINYARFFHTMSAWGHYGWLQGPWPFNHILKPHERP